jgi:type II secretory pathway component PulF
MPQFAYRAKDRQLNVVEGTIEAESESAALSRLGREGIFPISVSEAGTRPAGGEAPRRFAPARVSKPALAYTTRQLADLLGGGLPLLSALTLLAKQTEHRALQRVIDRLAGAVRDGRTFSDALGEHPAVFPPLYVSMIRAAEVGGALEQALARLADLGEQEAELTARVRSASAYPLFVLAMAVAMTGFLMAYVIPTLSQVFVESGQVLPWPTRFVLGVSGLVTHGWWVLLLAAVLLGWSLRAWRRSPAGRAASDRLLLTLPGFGGLLRRLDIARFARNLGVLIGQGVPVLQALRVAEQTLANHVVRGAVARVEEAVREGSTVAAALAASGQFPVFVSNMVAVGEEAGTVDAALLKVAGTYEREVDRTIRTLTTILEPVLLVAVGGVVMLIVLAMLLPIFQIGLVVQ